MKRNNLTTILATLTVASCLSVAAAETSARFPAIIPLPNQIKISKGSFSVTDSTAIRFNSELKNEAALLAEGLKQFTGTAPKLVDSRLRIALRTPITLTHEKDANKPESYSLEITQDGIKITGSDAAGAFYGCQTLLQMIEVNKGQDLPFCTINDSPRFVWRGLMLDEARHFMGKTYVKHLLKTMAAHKLNRFHWHLTDDQGWRIEIKQYPKLTEIGGWRGPGTDGPIPSWDKKSPISKKKYGGFYTQEDIKEIVAYASSLHIDILPEIDVPGHAMAIAIAYPEVLPKTDRETGKDVHNLRGNVLSVVSEENYRMLDAIFGEISALFPFPYIHVGGDEVNVNTWKASPEHRTFMEKNGLKNPHQLQNMFMLRLEKMLKSHGKTLMGWNEIMHGGKLSKDTGIMAWISIGAGLNAAKHGYPTVMAVGPHNYFDMHYPGHNETGHWWAGVVSTQRAYQWNPLFENQLTPAQQKNILGVHCALWTEFVPDPTDADYKLWPRACATAEVGWSSQSNRKWEDFSNRLGRHLNFLDSQKVGYRVKPPQAVSKQGKVVINPPYENAPANIYFTTDGSEPTAKTSNVYAGQSFDSADSSKLRYRTIRPNGRMSKIMQGAIQEAVGTWDKKILASTKILTFDISDVLTSSGNWIAEIKYANGKDAFNIETISILENGRSISSATGGVTHKDNRSLHLRLPVTKIVKGAKYQLQINLKDDTKNDSRGKILFDRSIWIEPETSVTTNVPHHGSHTVEKAANWIRSDWYWSNRNGKKGDQWTYKFAESVLLNSINLPSGKLNSNDDIIVDGILEISSDGITFRKAASFVTGSAKIEFKTPTTVKALRITLNTKHHTWIILRDPQMK